MTGSTPQKIKILRGIPTRIAIGDDAYMLGIQGYDKAEHTVRLGVYREVDQYSVSLAVGTRTRLGDVEYVATEVASSEVVLEREGVR